MRGGILILGAYFAMALNLRFWHHIHTCAQVDEVGGAVFLAAQVAVATLLLWPRMGKALLCALMLLSSVTTCFILKLGTHIDV